jgi:hypothetical protein
MNERYNIKDLFAENGSIGMVTEGGVVVQLTLDLLMMLVTPAFHDKEKRQPVRPPNKAELAMFANCILEDRLNPYKKECWLVWIPQAACYNSIVAAQSRMRKVMSLPDYEGWEWGYILDDGTRQEQGGKAPLPKIVGLWGRVYRADRKPYHHEMMRTDYKKGTNLTMCMKAHKDQAHRYAYADKLGNLNTDNEIPAMDFAEDNQSDEEIEPTLKMTEMGSQVVTAEEIKGGECKPIENVVTNIADGAMKEKIDNKDPLDDTEGYEVKVNDKPIDQIPDWAK